MIKFHRLRMNPEIERTCAAHLLVGQTLRAGQQSKSSGLPPLISIVRYQHATRYWRNPMKKAISCFLFLSVLSIHSHAQTFAAVGPTYINYVENGWFGEGIAIHVDQSAPAGCVVNTGFGDFGVRSDHPAYDKITALILSAFFSHSAVELVVNPGNCVFGNRTNVVSVRLIQ